MVFTTVSLVVLWDSESKVLLLCETKTNYILCGMAHKQINTLSCNLVLPALYAKYTVHGIVVISFDYEDLLLKEETNKRFLTTEIIKCDFN